MTESDDDVRPPVDATDVTLAELSVLRHLVRGEDPAESLATLVEASLAFTGPTGLDTICTACALSGFERAVLLLACGPELVGAVAGELEQRDGVAHLTFGSALSLLPDPHWSACAPASGLRRWRLLAPEDPSRPVSSRLLVDEHVLHLIVGLDDPDVRVASLSHPVSPPAGLPDSWTVNAADLAVRWVEAPVWLGGARPDDARAVAADAARRSARTLRELSAADLPADPEALRETTLLCAREAMLGRSAWWLDLTGCDPVVAARIRRAFRTCGYVAGAGIGAASTTMELAAPSLDERLATLDAALTSHGASTSPAELEIIADGFDPTLDQTAELALALADGGDPWESARRVTRRAPAGAVLLQPTADWTRLVLPDADLEQLRALTASVRHRTQVLDRWGFGALRPRGRGTSALFAGPSGTGKTFAAEVIAAELSRDLLLIDLSQVVSKYIGETEKQLAELFDTAERTGAVLLFDEADALFGKRTEVRDSHDRYANIEVSYLLQRLERFAGLTILTSNARTALDQAFLRRLTAIVTFGHPDAAARLALWEHAFPEAMPRGDLDLAALARVDATGATITAAALAGAFLAADAGEAVSTAHVLRALERELAKAGRPVVGVPTR